MSLQYINPQTVCSDKCSLYPVDMLILIHVCWGYLLSLSLPKPCSFYESTSYSSPCHVCFHGLIRDASMPNNSWGVTMTRSSGTQKCIIIYRARTLFLATRIHSHGIYDPINVLFALVIEEHRQYNIIDLNPLAYVLSVYLVVFDQSVYLSRSNGWVLR